MDVLDLPNPAAAAPTGPEIVGASMPYTESDPAYDVERIDAMRAESGARVPGDRHLAVRFYRNEVDERDHIEIRIPLDQ